VGSQNESDSKTPAQPNATVSKAYDSETISTFVYAFEPRVIAIHDEFKRKGLTDKVLEDEYVQPTNRYSIRAIAERIALLATKLPS
jgi:hypothetical protein